MPTDTAPIQTTAAVITSGAEAIRTAREFAASIADGVIERDRSGTAPVRELAALDASGLLAITVPRKHHGAEVPATVLAEVVREIAAVDPAIAQIPQGHFLLVDVLAVLGTPEQRRRLFAEVLMGGRLGNGLAERGGQHAQDLQTRLTRRGPLVRLTGRKYYCTGAITARWIGVTALDDAGRLVLAFVERDAPGVRLDSDWNVMGQRATISGGAQFDDVPVDPELVIPYQGAFEAPQQFGARAQLVHAAIEVGIARGALRDAGEFVRTRARPFFEAARAGWAQAARQAGLSEARLSEAGLSEAGLSEAGLSEAGVSAAEFREAMGHFATGVTVVTSVDADGKPVGTTANAVTSLSLDPPLVIVCFDLGSQTLRAIRGHGAFVVNVLAAPQQHLSRNFARRGLAAAWDGVRHRRGPTGSPRLEDVLAVLECTVEHALPGGDHEIIVGRVRHAETSANPNGPLVFFRGSYAMLTDQDLPACG